MNVIARLEYELAYYDSAVHRFNHYTTRTPLRVSQQKGRRIVRKRKLFLKAWNISRNRLQMQDLFWRGTNSKCADVIEHSSTWLFCPIRFPRLFNLFLYLFVSVTSEFWILFFPEMSTPRSLHRHIQKYWGVNPIP